MSSDVEGSSFSISEKFLDYNNFYFSGVTSQDSGVGQSGVGVLPDADADAGAGAGAVPWLLWWCGGVVLCCGACSGACE